MKPVNVVTTHIVGIPKGLGRGMHHEITGAFTPVWDNLWFSLQVDDELYMDIP